MGRTCRSKQIRKGLFPLFMMMAILEKSLLISIPNRKKSTKYLLVFIVALCFLVKSLDGQQDKSIIHYTFKVAFYCRTACKFAGQTMTRLALRMNMSMK